MPVTLAYLGELNYYTRYAQRLVIKFCCYLTENSVCFHYKWQPFNIMQEEMLLFIHSLDRKTQVYCVDEMQSFSFLLNLDSTCSRHEAFNDKIE